MKNVLKINEACKEKNIADIKEYIVGMLALLFSIAVAWIIIPKIVSFLNPAVDTSQMKNLFISTDIGVGVKVIPELTERAVFVNSVFLIPVLLLAFTCFFNYFFKKISDLLTIKYVYNIFSVIFLIFIAYLTWIANIKDRFFYFQNSIGIGFGPVFFVAIISCLANLLILNYSENNILKKLVKIVSILTDLTCWIAIFALTLMSIYGTKLVNETGVYNAHFESVFYPVVQVFLGKEILYDFFAQYGLYAHILEPIWKITGLSVFKFTLIFGCLAGMSVYLLYKFLKEITDNKIICYTGFTCLMWIYYMYSRITTMNWGGGAVQVDPAFQHLTIRFLFPAISVYLTYHYFKTASQRLYYLSFFIYAVSIIWNPDCGLVVYLTWLITLIYEGLCDRNIKRIFFHIVNWFLILFVTIGLFTLYMCLRYGHMPIYKEFFLYQKIYSTYGLGMLPMPVIHPWNLVVVIYVMGMAISFINLLKGSKSLKVFMIFNLVILGVGMFTYYQGRSHDYNLTDISYPAIMILIIFADEIVKMIKNHKSMINFIALNYITFFTIYCLFCFVSNYKIVFRIIKERIEISNKSEETHIMRSARFIKNNTKRGEEILLLSNHSGIYFLESETTSPIKSLPGHLVLISEINDVLDYLKSDLCKRVFIDSNFTEKTLWNFIQTNFKLSLISPDRNIGLFVK